MIATYNRSADLKRCLDSILQQQGCEIEVIVVDDASTDDTCEMVRQRYGDRVRLIARDINVGSIRNRNYGAEMAQGDILFLIDDDTELPGKTTAAETVADFDDPIIGAVAVPYLQDGKMHHVAPVAADPDKRYVVASYVGCACAVRRDTFLDNGGYEQFFRHGVEEDDFCIRMMNAGSLCVVGKVSMPVVHHESPARNLFNWDYYPRRSSILYIWKNCPTAYVLQNLMTTSLRGFLHCFRVRRFAGNFRGLWDGYVGILLSLAGKGCERKPVHRNIYILSRRLRKKALLLDEVREIISSS